MDDRRLFIDDPMAECCMPTTWPELIDTIGTSSDPEVASARQRLVELAEDVFGGMSDAY